MKQLLIAFVCFAFVGCSTETDRYLITYQDGSKEIYLYEHYAVNGNLELNSAGCVMINATPIRCGAKSLSYLGK